MLEFIIPNQKNNFHPYLLRSKILSIPVILLAIFNFVVPLFSDKLTQQIYAASFGAGEVIAFANSDRAGEGLGALRYNQQLTNAACAKANNMIQLNYWSHFGPNGESPWQFIGNAGYSYDAAGENLGKGYNSASALNSAWMNSPTHRANIMNGNFVDIGVCVVDGTLQGENTTLVVQMFGRPAGYNPNPEPIVETTNTNNNSNPSSPTQTVSSSKSSSRPYYQPVVIKDTTPPRNPEIDSPENGIYTNSDEIDITGKYFDDTTKITVFDNENTKGEAILNNGIWDYKLDTKELERESTLNVSAKALDAAGNISDKSNQVEIKIDKVAPTIETNSFKVTQNQDKTYTLSIPFTENNIDKVILKDKLAEIPIKIESNIISWNTDINNLTNYNISLTDKAQNVTSLEIPFDQVVASIKSIPATVSNDISTGISNEIKIDLGNIFSDLKLLDLKQSVNFTFLLGFVFLLGLDSYVIHLHGIKVPRKSKSLFHLMPIILIAVMILAGSFGKII